LTSCIKKASKNRKAGWRVSCSFVLSGEGWIWRGEKVHGTSSSLLDLLMTVATGSNKGRRTRKKEGRGGRRV